MAEQETDETEVWYYNQLKKYDVKTLEQTIAKAVSDLIGVDLECSIANVDYDYEAPLRTTKAKFNLTVSKPHKGFDS